MGTTHEITRNLGGDRLGSGNKNNVTLHNYNRSNHDLSYAWRSTMNVGTLVPFMKLLEETGDSFSINLNAVAKTIPTIGPLYGAFKLQLDVFECPLRLYNGLLHNNMTKIGMNMKSVKLPKVVLSTKGEDLYTQGFDTNCQISSSSLIKYLGISGVGARETTDVVTTTLSRKFNAVPIMAYWDIVKNYYSNKQEEIGAYINKKSTQSSMGLRYVESNGNSWNLLARANSTLPTGVINPTTGYQEIDDNGGQIRGLVNNGTIYITFEGEIDPQYLYVTFPTGTELVGNMFTNVYYDTHNRIVLENAFAHLGEPIVGFCYKIATVYTGETIIETFPLSNIDDARIQILKKTGLNQELVLNTDCNFKPYDACFEVQDGYLLSRYGQQGLALKTYQSDLLQNWLKTDWIDGTNGINTITAVDTSSGSFQIDALNLANKVYNMLNRIAVSGGTYEDWQEAVFTANTNRRAETPVYRGGLACEICFDEVVSTAYTDKAELGSLGGRAVLPKEGIRGGHIEITANEPAYILGIVSITPRIDYSQGNDWDMTELDTMDDLHKPALDGIGFEDLLQERAAWFGTYYDRNTTNWVKMAMGKTPAWLNYMTSVNKNFGGFAEKLSNMFMTLNRDYAYDENRNGILDLTTYIDPRKYNYAFADTSLDAQNFWIQIGVEVKARRVMSAKILPNL